MHYNLSNLEFVPVSSSIQQCLRSALAVKSCEVHVLSFAVDDFSFLAQQAFCINWESLLLLELSPNFPCVWQYLQLWKTAETLQSGSCFPCLVGVLCFPRRPLYKCVTLPWRAPVKGSSLACQSCLLNGHLVGWIVQPQTAASKTDCFLSCITGKQMMVNISLWDALEITIWTRA